MARLRKPCVIKDLGSGSWERTARKSKQVRRYRKILGNLKKQLEEEEKAKLRSQLAKENMELHKKWNLRSKIEFAIRGYRFKNNPD